MPDGSCFIRFTYLEPKEQVDIVSQESRVDVEGGVDGLPNLAGQHQPLDVLSAQNLYHKTNQISMSNKRLSAKYLSRQIENRQIFNDVYKGGCQQLTSRCYNGEKVKISFNFI